MCRATQPALSRAGGYVAGVSHAFHVTSAVNRESIRAFGLDVGRMGAARGIAGSREPEQPGCFLALDEFEVAWFIRMNNTGGPVDLWRVADVDHDDLVCSPEGHYYYPGVIPPEHLALVRSDIAPQA